MTVATESSKAGPYLCNGSQTMFPFGFKVPDASSIAVYLDEVKVPPSDYSVALSGTGGSVSMITPPPSESVLAIVRDMEVVQETDLQQGAAFYPEVIENALDRLTMICQQLKEMSSRTLTVPPTRGVDKESLYQQFNTLVTNAETWADQAMAGAETAISASTSATAAANSAASNSAIAIASKDNALAAANSAASASTNAVTAATEINALANRSALNCAIIAFGDWGDDGFYVAYSDWTDAESLTSVNERIANHNDNYSAHAALFNAKADINHPHTPAQVGADPAGHAAALVVWHDEYADAHAGLFTSEKIMPLAGNRCYISPLITPVAGTRSTVTHNLDLSDAQLASARAECRLKCVVDSLGYTAGEYAQGGLFHVTVLYPMTPLLTANTVSIVTGSSKIAILWKDTGVGDIPNLAHWAYEFRIWY